jgi:hypothetical protein
MQVEGYHLFINNELFFVPYYLPSEHSRITHMAFLNLGDPYYLPYEHSLITHMTFLDFGDEQSTILGDEQSIILPFLIFTHAIYILTHAIYIVLIIAFTYHLYNFDDFFIDFVI